MICFSTDGIVGCGLSPEVGTEWDHVNIKGIVGD